MITLKDRRLIVPKSDEIIGFTGDHNVEVRQFQLPLTWNDIDLTELDWKLDTSINGIKNIIELTKTVSDELILTWTVKQSHLNGAGFLSIQLRGVSGDAIKWHSNVVSLRVGGSIGAVSAQPEILPSEFEQMEQRIAAMQSDVIARQAEINDTRVMTISKTEPTNGLWIRELN